MGGRTIRGAWVALGLATIALPAQAQLLDRLQGGGQGGGGGLLGGGLPSVDQASPSNTAGVLQYCIRNNYLGGNSATSIGSALSSRVGGDGRGDSGYRAGESGMLQTGGGQSYGLGGGSSGGLKAQVTHKICDLVLQHAKSLL